jgi:hypothetical protein
MTTPAPAGQTGHETTTYTYDGNGNVITTTAPPATGTTNQVTTDTYNTDGQLAAETVGSGTTAASTTSYCYDPNGDTTAVVMPTATGVPLVPWRHRLRGGWRWLRHGGNCQAVGLGGAPGRRLGGGSRPAGRGDAGPCRIVARGLLSFRARGHGPGRDAGPAGTTLRPPYPVWLTTNPWK